MNNAQHQAIPASIESYRDATRKTLWLDHRPKHCACGRTVTAKQLAQYRMCKHCFEEK